MSWDEVTGGVSPVTFSSVESERFGIPIARLNVGIAWKCDFEDSATLFEHVTAEIREAHEVNVIVRFPSGLAHMGTAALLSGRKVLPAGCLMYWEADLQNFKSFDQKHSEWIIRPIDSGESDTHNIAAAIEDSFSGYTNHYSANPALDEALIVSGYREWAESTVRSSAGCAIALEVDGDFIGFATTRDSQTDTGTREIELAGITSLNQGKGLYRALLDGLASIAQADHCSRLVISTQSHNLRAQRAWASAGFRPVVSLDTIHCVRS